ncbi:MAG: imidazoleglycerol-phosphate dehydratase HisB [Proteobacteria bacterium]|jgi:imidazoleglycerol-phosphate dehydratase|nr:imidazoleglycerol-phosphate dehydratase HisB [Desulfocapsa sp.]MBU3945806.1 imidazoleglycerol-phosphate dehydratase HisB [Pseudomonadota bacterium]MCG2745452.1 imidazoleglycerol-phosphate dehydratase HisB [Desulfobacteraceae bacterium]MBU3984352.1 imidazoleglycerol-phosphate dehydratase HisB [Pseudomonadota bacterium]MBU4030098.1 imidazoleglycerol-phosphate dehydratase HisB [Pseudomonadota bacterium]
MDALEQRSGEVKRVTRETDIQLTLLLDGTGITRIDTSVPFLNHMLTLFAVHGFFDLEITATGDIEIDDHHTVEDIGISLGQAFAKALGDKSGINRYGLSYLPMDEALVRVVVDISNRPFLHYVAAVPEQKVGNFDTALVLEFMRAFSQHAGVTLHIDLLHGENSHHILEAIFKGLARAMDQATGVNRLVTGTLSSKGLL